MTCVPTGSTDVVSRSHQKARKVWTSGLVPSVRRLDVEWKRKNFTVCAASPTMKESTVYNVLVIWGWERGMAKKGWTLITIYDPGRIVFHFGGSNCHVPTSAGPTCANFVHRKLKVKILAHHWVFWHNCFSSECQRLNKTVLKTQIIIQEFFWLEINIKKISNM